MVPIGAGEWRLWWKDHGGRRRRFLMFYCPNGKKAKLRKAMETSGLREMHYAFDFEGAKVLVNFCRPLDRKLMRKE
jgi:hypothetical protein